MSTRQEQLIALGAIFQAAVLADQVARTGQLPAAQLGCLLGSLLVRNPETTQEIYGGSDIQLQEGYRALVGALERDASTLQREPLKYALAMIGLERRLAKRDDMLQLISKRLDQIQQQVEHFGITHENVIASFGSLYQDTLSNFRQRIQVHGDMRYLQQSDKAAMIRALLLAGIRAARLWRQLGGHRWQLIFSRAKLLDTLYPLIRRTE
ncbi:high frequency lysogenization protein HflD [Azomonas macrocytogenes]|uniref:High frequency lysogenization protein HflD homolog n=1 Tax=Azomonas macrocytogenes TaxID=69962 RepID=A0A839SX11_AZOMA|nr:high frequency lysogenization protein HflD [Azomonas macrocytogenes]MBB3101652.1 high frequency lysogenization protein [Azomonas macrocytogenes]